jgi:hypothetical protein
MTTDARERNPWRIYIGLGIPRVAKYPRKNNKNEAVMI